MNLKRGDCSVATQAPNSRRLEHEPPRCVWSGEGYESEPKSPPPFLPSSFSHGVSLCRQRDRVCYFDSSVVVKRVGTHNVSFHCVEALSCFVIRLPDKISDADIV